MHESPSGGYRDSTRSYRVDVDGNNCGKVPSNGSVSVDVEPGHHTVRARIDWTGSPDLDVEVLACEEVHVDVLPGGGAFSLWQMFGRTGYMKTELRR